MAGNIYTPGQAVVMTGTFTVASVLTDPTTISLTVIDPLGNTTTYTYAGAQVVRNSVGAYQYTLLVQTVGFWQYKWQGTGTCQAAVDGSFGVQGF